MGGCCSALADVNTQEWARWADHPVRKDYDVVMDLGEGAFSLVQHLLGHPQSVVANYHIAC